MYDDLLNLCTTLGLLKNKYNNTDYVGASAMSCAENKSLTKEKFDLEQSKNILKK